MRTRRIVGRVASDLSGVVIDSGVWIPRSRVPSVNALSKSLTVTPFTMGEAPEPVIAIQIERHGVRVPRAYGLHLIAEMGIHDAVDARSDGTIRVFPKCATHTGKYAYQEPFVRQMLAAAERYGDFLAEAHTGSGKTEVALSMVQRIGRTALVVVDQENLLTQWIDRAKRVLGLSSSQIGIVQGDTCDYEGKFLVIAMMQSLSQRRYDLPLYDWPGVLVMDECHTAGAPTFSRVLMQFSARIRVGISATVDRKDELQKIIHWNLGEVRAALRKDHDKSFVYVMQSHTVYSWYATVSPKTGRIIEEVTEDAQRNRMIVEAIKWLYDTGRETLVVSDRIEQLEGLRSMLHYAGVPEAETGLYTGFRTVWGYVKDPTPPRKPVGLEKGAEYSPVKFAASRKKIPSKTLEVVKNTARVIFSTYGMMAKGVDVPRLSGGIDCSHRSKAKQVHGRVLRHVDGKLVPIWITIRDVNCYRLEHQFVQRVDEYTDDNADIYEFDMELVRRCDARTLKKAVRSNIKELECLKILKHADGYHVLA